MVQPDPIAGNTMDSVGVVVVVVVDVDVSVTSRDSNAYGYVHDDDNPESSGLHKRGCYPVLNHAVKSV